MDQRRKQLHSEHTKTINPLEGEGIPKFKSNRRRTSLVEQWLRTCLPMQGIWVQSLVQEDPTCCGATKPMCHNYWACALEPVSHNYWAHAPQLLKPACSRAHVLQLLSPHAATTEAACLEPVLRNKRSHRNEKPALATTRESPRTATKTQCSQK